MKQRLKSIILAAVMFCSGGLMLAPAVVHADFKSDACQGVNTIDGSTGGCSGNADKTIGKIVKQVVRILSIVVGFVAVIMMIVGGLKMITAGGDSGAVASARSTIIYALVGLIIVAVAQVLVHYVIFNTSKAL